MWRNWKLSVSADGRFNNTFYQFQEWPHGEIWGLGDSPTVGLLLAEVQRTDLYEMVEAPEISYEDMSYHFTGKNRKSAFTMIRMRS